MFGCCDEVLNCCIWFGHVWRRCFALEKKKEGLRNRKVVDERSKFWVEEQRGTYTFCACFAGSWVSLIYVEWCKLILIRRRMYHWHGLVFEIWREACTWSGISQAARPIAAALLAYTSRWGQNYSDSAQAYSGRHTQAMLDVPALLGRLCCAANRDLSCIELGMTLFDNASSQVHLQSSGTL